MYCMHVGQSDIYSNFAVSHISKCFFCIVLFLRLFPPSLCSRQSQFTRRCKERMEENGGVEECVKAGEERPFLFLLWISRLSELTCYFVCVCVTR